MRDVLAIREHAQKTRKAIVIGGGVLGLEFAASLRKLGLQVGVVEIFPRLLPRQLDHDGAGVLKDRIASLGIDIYLGSKTEEILGSKTVSGIRLDTGKELTGNLVLISAGVRSNIDLAASSGIHVKRGVIVDHRLQTNVPDVYAAGDTAEFEGRTYGIIPAAMEQAKIAAWNMVTKNQQVYTGTIPSNTLKIVGIDLASLGLVNPEDPRYVEIQKIDKEKGVYKKIVLENGKIVGAILLGARKGVTAIKEMIERETDVTKHKDSILDDDFDLRRVRP
jgi:nitrite reductase (NADH) large subunit